jgi:secreted trypsin-like serine protease
MIFQKSFGKIISFALLFAANYSTLASINQPRIAHGIDAPEGAYPFFARLRITDGDDNRWSCGGTLVAPDWIATAAHCAARHDGQLDPRRIEVYLKGEGGLDGTPFNATGYRVPSRWNMRGSTLAGDIMLIRLPSPTGVSPVQIASSLPRRGSLLTIMGLGQTETPNMQPTGDDPKRLLVGYMPLLSKKEALRYLNEEKIWNGIEPDHFATGLGTDAMDTCVGDSGGPVLSASGKLVGIVSYGYSPCGSDKPVNFMTDVTMYRVWLMSVIRHSGTGFWYTYI